MSLNTMKRKTAAKLNLSGKGPKQTWMSQGPHGKSVTHVISTGFSLNGGHRNIGRVGQTNLGRSVTRTPFRGNAPMGNGGSNGKYPIVISNSGSCCTNRSDFIKPSSLNTKGMLARKYKWLNGGGTDHHGNPAHNPVKPDDNYPENFSQSSYIQSKASTAAITSIVNDGGDKSCLAIGGKCGHHIGGKYYQRNMYYKNPSQPLDYAQYKLFLNRKSLRNCAYCACEDPNADPKTCKKKKLCPPGSCPTCKGHYDSTAGASIESPEFDARLGLNCYTACITNGKGSLSASALKILNDALLSDNWRLGMWCGRFAMLYGDITNGPGVIMEGANPNGDPNAETNGVAIGIVPIQNPPGGSEWDIWLSLNNLTPAGYVDWSGLSEVVAVPVYAGVPSPATNAAAAPQVLNIVKRYCGSIVVADYYSS